MDITFTPKQAQHAQHVAMVLFKGRRFFLPKECGLPTGYTLPYLSPTVFEELYRLNKLFEDEYHLAAKQAEKRLRVLEHEHGLKTPVLKSGQNISECNRYSGGLDIVAILPLQALLDQYPISMYSRLDEELLNANFPVTKRGDFTPNEIKEAQILFATYAHGIYEEFAKLALDGGFEHKVIVVLESRFKLSSIDGGQLQEKLTGLSMYPHLSSYLLFRASIAGTHFSQLPNTIFVSSRTGHIRTVRVDEEHVRLYPEAQNGYACEVAIATIL